MITAGNIIALSVIIFIASIVRGFTGFGLALVAVPLIQFFMPVTDTAVFIAMINVIFSAALFPQVKGNSERPAPGCDGCLDGSQALPQVLWCSSLSILPIFSLYGVC